MPAPKPLTACDPPGLDWSRPEAPAATDFDDIYFSVDGGLEETRAVYLEGCGLPERWAGRKNFVIGELGFGSGLNVLAAWQMWEASKPDGAHLHILSVEKFPFDHSQLARALSAWPELKAYSDRLIECWPGRVKGTHILHLSSDVTLTLLHDDVLPALENLNGAVDAWFLDGFSPAKNPQMWSTPVMEEVGRLSASGARVGTFTVAGFVRQGLKSAGFDVKKKPGFGRKRQRLEAIYRQDTTNSVVDMRPVIVGAGIAGACLARSFLRRGITPIVIDPGDGTAASGNPAAIVKPRLDLQDRPESRFFLSSYLHALRAYEDGGFISSQGVFHAAKTPEEKTRFEKLAQLEALPKEHMQLAAGPFELGGLSFPKALTIDPVKTCAQFLSGSPRLMGKAKTITQNGEDLQVQNENGDILASGSHIFFAVGAGAKNLEALAALNLRYSRGQISMVNQPSENTLTYGGYAVPMGAETLLGATHARLSGDNPYAVTAQDDQENLDKYKQMTGETPSLVTGRSRASIRVNRANTLPLISLNNRIGILTGLGSRGFVFAPLLAEIIVAKSLGEPHVDLGKIMQA